MIYDLKKIGISLFGCLSHRFPLRLAVTSDIMDVASIPRSTRFSHPYGITIGKGTKIGENCVFGANVTIGMKYPKPYIPINKPDGVASIGNNVFIGAGVVILGPVHIGDGAILGANTIITEDVPPGSVYTGRQHG